MIYRTRNTRLGLKLGAANLGWALLRLGLPKAVAIEHGDVEQLIDAKLAGRSQQDGEVVIYVYLDDTSFAGSIAQREGLTRAQHRVLAERHAVRLSEQGWVVNIMEIEA